MSLLNFIAGGLGAGGGSNQARTTFGNGNEYIFNSSFSSINLSKISNKSTTPQTNNRSHDNFHIQYAIHINRNKTQDPTLYPVNSFFSNNRRDPILYSVNSFFSNHHNAFFPPPQNFKVYDHEILSPTNEHCIII